AGCEERGSHVGLSARLRGDFRAPGDGYDGVAPDLRGARQIVATTPRNASLECPSHMDRERKTIAATMEPLEATNRSRLAETYVRYAPEGIRLAYLLTGDRALAEDLVHEAFLRFVGRLHFLRDPEAFEGARRRTIVNLSKNHFRRRAVERSYLAREAGRAPDVRNDPDVPTYESMRTALLSLP